MKVVVINGSAKPNGNTAFALDMVAGVLHEQGIETERINIGAEALHGCVGCGVCLQKKNKKCRFTDDSVNDWLEKMINADGILLGSPVYYAGINGALKSFLDRAFYVTGANGSLFRHKVGAGVVAVRRAGSIAALDQLNKYLSITEMFIPSSNYWSLIYGMTPGEAGQDTEGIQCLRVLGANMAWLLKIIENGKDVLPPPVYTAKARMNFIR